MKNIKLFITYKNNHKLLKTDIIEPIQTGRGIAREVFDGMIGDDTGENISVDNPRYNELSAQYWVWKNYEQIGVPEYVGFMHYRRHFVFLDSDKEYSKFSTWLPGAKIFNLDNFKNKLCKKNLDSETITKAIADNQDCYVLKPYDIRFFHNNDLYIKEHYISTIPGAKRYIWDIFYSTIKRLYPNYSEILDDFTYGHRINPCNMFIMKKDLFFEYSEFCFNILKEVDRQIDSSKFTSQEQRFLGFLGEYLLTIFVLKLEKDNKKVKSLDGFFYSNVDNNISLKDIFSITNSSNKTHKIVKFLGIKLKIKCSKASYIQYRLQQQDFLIQMLVDKVTELQEEIILSKKGKQ